MTSGSALQRLERYALAGRSDARRARGRCLHATVRLGREALRLGVGDRVAFVRWDVRDDPDFLEHWALALDDGRVLDMTAAQVDGDPRPLRRLDGYPGNFVRPRRYPAAALVAILHDRDHAGSRYPARQLWALHRRLFRHDAAAAWRARSPAALWQATRAVGRAALGLSLEAARGRAFDRLSTLLARQGR